MSEKRKDFLRGYVIACCNLVMNGGDHSSAYDVLNSVEIKQSDIDAMNLAECDLEALSKVRNYNGPDCITAHK